METVFKLQTRGPEKFVDSVTGQPLGAVLVRAARQNELQYFEDKRVWTRRPREEALRRTRKRPIIVK